LRRQNGTVASPEAARLLGARGPAAKARRARFVSAFGLGDLAEGAPLAPWLKSGEDLATAELARYAEAIGAPPSAGLSTLVTSWALQVTASRFVFARAAESGDPAALKMASSLAADARASQLTIVALAEREAAARPRAPVDPLASYLTTSSPPHEPPTSATSEASPLAPTPAEPSSTAHPVAPFELPSLVAKAPQ